MNKYQQLKAAFDEKITLRRRMQIYGFTDEEIERTGINKEIRALSDELDRLYPIYEGLDMI